MPIAPKSYSCTIMKNVPNIPSAFDCIIIIYTVGGDTFYGVVFMYNGTSWTTIAGTDINCDITIQNNTCTINAISSTKSLIPLQAIYIPIKNVSNLP